MSNKMSKKIKLDEKNIVDYYYPSDIDNIIVKEYYIKKFPRVPKFYADKNLYIIS